MLMSSKNQVSLKMIFEAKTFLEKSVVLEIPTVTTYPEFAQDLLQAAFNAKEDDERLEVSSKMVERCLRFFEQSLVLTIPTVVTYPDFIKDMLKYSMTIDE